MWCVCVRVSSMNMGHIREHPGHGHSRCDLLPTPRVGQGFVFLLPASCLLKTFHWPPASGRKRVQKGRNGDTPLGPRGDLLALQVEGVVESRGDGLGAPRMCTFLTPPSPPRRPVHPWARPADFRLSPAGPRRFPKF